MSGNLQLYSLAYVTFDNAIASQEGMVSIRRTTGSQPVATVALGYAGESPGAAMCEIEIESAVPFAGLEFDPTKNMQGLIPIEVGVVIAGKVAKSKGFIHEDDYRHAVNQESKQTIRFRGQYPRFE